MAQELKKEIEVKGNEKTVKGEVVVRLNYRTETKKFHNRGTHEEAMKRFNYHIVKGFIDGEEVESSEEFINKQDAPFHAKAVEKALRGRLTARANSKTIVPVDETLKNMGFQ